MTANVIDIVVREIPSDVSALGAELSDEERAYASGLAERRRREWITWRAVLRGQTDRWALSDKALRVAYAESGEPLFEGMQGALSVTHSRRYVAVARTFGGRCGVDIEHLNRNFEHIENKYISDAEKDLVAASDERFRAAAWCVKEAMFKCVGRVGVDFRRDLRIVEVNFESGRVLCEAFGKRLSGTVQLLDGAILAAVADLPDPKFIIR